MSVTYASPVLPFLSPFRARLLNALLARTLPLEFTADAGTELPVGCRLELNGNASAAEAPEPFDAAATLFARSGAAVWKLEFSSLEPLALRPELAAWRLSALNDAAPEDAGTETEEHHFSFAHDFFELPEELRLAVLERLFAPAMDSLGRWLGCAVQFCPKPDAELLWAEPLPLILTLPGNRTVYLHLFWSEEQSARFILERLETLPLRTVQDRNVFLPDAALACPLEVGSMPLSSQEAAALVPGDILLPERWIPETPRLVLPGGTALTCRLENGILTVLGPDVILPPRTGESSAANEVSMNNAVSEQSEISEQKAEENGAVLLEQKEINALELPVTFELASISLRVEELAAITPGHTFALGGDVTSVPVFLRVGGRLMARGRLVDVGGMPGVQIVALESSEAGRSNGIQEGTSHGNGRD